MREGTLVTDFRLKAMILLIMIAYTSATFQGKKIKQMGLQQISGSGQRISSNSTTAQ